MRRSLLSFAVLVVSACNPPPDVSALSTSCETVDDCAFVTPVETRCDSQCFCGAQRVPVNADAAEAYREETGPQLPCTPEFCLERAACVAPLLYCAEGACGVAYGANGIPEGASSTLDE